MSNHQTTINNSGLGITSLLTLVFIFLKLTNQIDWPWLWVLSPIWLVGAVFVGVIALVVLIALIFK